ncbi:NXPE family member 3-like [Ylistrum balloti]|uniref:NXPE family member 3-like n=1 Tax=Ylistrum balloti TaxID=509963 RepID=UPI002905CDF9|nr:NXPE family member 3-like [Ylistrum balloti]
MSVTESVYFRRILFCGALIVIIWITCFLPRFDPAVLPDIKEIYKSDVPSAIPIQASNLSNSDVTSIIKFIPKVNMSVYTLYGINTYMEFKDYKDFHSLVNISNSVITVRSSNVSIGDDIIVDIVLYNGRGERSKMGGDILRVWLREPSVKASVSGHVTDHGDGSYTGVVKAMWAGKPEVMFSIANTKEHVGIFMNIVHKYGLIMFLKAGFRKGNRTETTLCSVLPNIPHVIEYCNFTAQIYNMSFFCGKPFTMSCEDWIVYERALQYPCSEKHQLLFSKYKYFKKRVSRVTVLSNSGARQEPMVSCSDIKSEVTWQISTPAGYFYNGKWRSLLCKTLMPWKRESYAKCLKDRPLLMTGDSTIRNWFQRIAELLKLTILVGKKEVTDKAWQKFSEAGNRTESLELYWAPHGIPFFSYEQNKKNLRSAASRIDDLPGNKSVILVLHWFSHVARTNPQNYRELLRSAKQAIIRLLKRSPNSRVLIKGPHAFTYFMFLGPIDYLGMLYKQILYEEFKDLQRKVYYIDQWDATIGNENINNHPEYPSYNPMMINLLFSFICE